MTTPPPSPYELQKMASEIAAQVGRNAFPAFIARYAAAGAHRASDPTLDTESFRLQLDLQAAIANAGLKEGVQQVGTVFADAARHIDDPDVLGRFAATMLITSVQTVWATLSWLVYNYIDDEDADSIDAAHREMLANAERSGWIGEDAIRLHDDCTCWGCLHELVNGIQIQAAKETTEGGQA